METSTGFRPDQSHVPQQSRRDKLRVQQVSASSLLQSSSHHLDGHNLPNNNLEHFTLFHPDNSIINHHVRNARHAGFLYDVPSSIIPSEMLDFSRNPNNSSNSNVVVRNSVGCHDHNSEWRSSQLNPVHYQGFDWPSSTNFAGNLTNPSTSDHHPIISGQVGQKYLDAMNFLEDHNNIVTVASTGPRNQQDMEMSGVRDQNELALLPLSFVNRSTTARFDNADGRRHDHHHQNWNTSTSSDHEELIRSTTSTGISTRVVSDSNLQGLSLSLSSINPQLQGSSGLELDFPMNKAVKSSPGHIGPQPCSIPKPSIISKACGKSLQDIVGASSGGYRSTAGPLGPFTGYATILKSSRFLQPARQLLDEFCGSEVLGMEGATCDLLDHNNSERGSAGEVSGSGNSGEGLNANESEVGVKMAINNNNNNNSSCGTSSSTFYGSNEMSSGEHGGVGSSVSFGSSRPEQAQQKKAKLLYLQEEVSRKYRQYRQQMQMVVSSFESVAGLSSATPYISVALKAVSRHFRCLKNAITDQLNHTRKALGEDLPSPTTASSSKGDHAMSTLKIRYMEHSFQRHKSGGANMAFPEPQQHIWRPQRGLPERSVAILRAWLFEHFLHPYPTDTDKHMLATQTGLTRNQVSNWFINARVRVWKPMVEEIHTLETKALADQVDRGPGKHDANPASNDHAASTKLGTSAMPGKPLECPGPDYSAGNHKLMGADQQQQSQDKRLRMECQVPTGMTGTLMGFVPYHRSGLEVWTRANQ